MAPEGSDSGRQGNLVLFQATFPPVPDYGSTFPPNLENGFPFREGQTSEVICPWEVAFSLGITQFSEFVLVVQQRGCICPL